MYSFLVVTLFIFSTSLEITKYCNQCKYFKASPHFIEESKCKKFPVYINKEPIDYFKCIVARTYSDMCGQEGRYYYQK